MMTRRSNVAMRELNDNMDHKNMVVTWINFADELNFFLIACIKEEDVVTFLVLGPVLNHIFGPMKDKLFYLLFVFRRGMSNAICDMFWSICFEASTFLLSFLKFKFQIFLKKETMNFLS